MTLVVFHSIERELAGWSPSFYTIVSVAGYCLCSPSGGSSGFLCDGNTSFHTCGMNARFVTTPGLLLLLQSYSQTLDVFSSLASPTPTWGI